MIDPSPSTTEREAIIARLTAAFAEDRISLEEFERRAEEVYRAATPMALTRLTSDLPAEITPAPADASVPAARSQMPPRISSVLGSVERGGRLSVPRRLEIRAVLANVELDLREAIFESGVTEIAVRAAFANVEVLLPAGLTVEHHGDALLGSFVAHAGAGPTGSTARTLRITGRALLSSVIFTGPKGDG